MSSSEQSKQQYGRLLMAGKRKLSGSSERIHPLDSLVYQFSTLRASGEKVSIRSFCSQNKIHQSQFEARLRIIGQGEEKSDPQEKISSTAMEYYSRDDVGQALYTWAKGRRLALHFAQGVIGSGFRKQEDVAVLAAAARTEYPTFHTSVGRYEGTHLTRFDLIAEVDVKGDWEECFRVTRPLVKTLSSLGLKFLVKFSGHSSAHVIVPCKGCDYVNAAKAFFGRLPGAMRWCGKLDLSFKWPQHFLRMPYALHEKTGLVSLPILPEEYDSFNPEMARPENIKVDLNLVKSVLDADNTAWVFTQEV